MGKFTARLVGESDGHAVTRQFEDQGRAVAWLKGAGLVDFDDQTACGEIRSETGDIVWRRSHLLTATRAAREVTRDLNDLFARVGVDFRKSGSKG